MIGDGKVEVLSEFVIERDGTDLSKVVEQVKQSIQFLNPDCYMKVVKTDKEFTIRAVSKDQNEEW